MDSGTQRHLAELLSEARGGPLVHDWNSWIVETYQQFAAALNALLAARTISVAEASDYQNRMLLALGRDPVGTLPEGSQRIPYLWVGTNEPIELPRQDAPAQLVRIIETTGSVLECSYGGRLQVLKVELFDTQSIVHWRIEVRPDTEARFVEALSAHDSDTEGLPQVLRDELRHVALQYPQSSVDHFRLADDIGTGYLTKSRSSGTGAEGELGRSRFLPGVPESAKILYLEWYGSATDIPLRDT